MKRILFVDHDRRALEAIRRRFFDRRHQWEIDFALTGQDALDDVAEEPYDLVVAAKGLPDLDGLVVLSESRRKQPLVGCILVGDGPLDAIRAAGVAHQILARPCELSALEAAVESVLRLKDACTHPTVREIVGGTRGLPSPPQTYIALTTAMRDPDVPIGKLAEIVEQDPAMTTKLLQIVSSPVFGSRHRVTHVRHALTMLGLSMVRDLVLGLEVYRVFGNLPPGVRLFVETHRDHAMTTARIAAAIAGPQRAGEAFTAGMIHDVGALMIASRSPDDLYAFSDVAVERKVASFEIEREAWGISHAEIGGHLLGAWGIPARIVEAVAGHHTVRGRPMPEPSLQAIVHVADAFAHETDVHKDVCERLDHGRLALLGLTDRLGEWRRRAQEALSVSDAA